MYILSIKSTIEDDIIYMEILIGNSDVYVYLKKGEFTAAKLEISSVNEAIDTAISLGVGIVFKG